MQHEFARLDRYMRITNSYMDTSTLMSCPIVRLAHKLFLLLACLNAMPAFAYEIDGTKWIGGRTAFYVDLDGDSYSEISWSEAVLEALAEWSENTVFDFSVVEEYRDPCSDDGYSSIDFAEDLCGFMGVWDSGPIYDILEITEDRLVIHGPIQTGDCQQSEGWFTLIFVVD